MRLFLGNCLHELNQLSDNSIDSVVTDPPYGLSFMGKKWDYDVPSVEIWKEVLRVLKPGGHLLSFGGTRTYHRMVVNIEDAGFEIRDQIMWIYGSGFPKSQDISKAIDKQAGAKREVIGVRKAFANRANKIRVGSNFMDEAIKDGSFSNPQTVGQITAPATDSAKQWQGWGTALKPANEPIVVARKPIEKGLTIAQNVQKWGTGGINVDGCRISPSQLDDYGRSAANSKGTVNAHNGFEGKSFKIAERDAEYASAQGRWPANILFDEVAAEMLDEQSGVSNSGKFSKSGGRNLKGESRAFGSFDQKIKNAPDNYGDSGGASRFFFIAKSEHDKTTSWLDLKNSDIARPVDSNSKCDEERLSFALEAVKTNCKKDPQLLRCLDSMPDYKKCILIQDLVLNAKKSESIGTTEIIQSCLRLSGFVPHAIASNTQDLAKDTESDCVPTRFLYQAKASKSERNRGLEGIVSQKQGARPNSADPTGKFPDHDHRDSGGNFHPTVKPIKLMEYLCKLVTPPNGTVLDPFMGSGSTGVAAKNLGFDFVGVEMNEEYFEIAQRRVQ